MKEEFKRTLILCVDSYENGVPKGRLCNAHSEESCCFQSLVQLLTLIEQKLDEAKFPQAFDSLRTFGPPQCCSTSEEAGSICSGAVATFSVRILFRQNASWQGSLTWLEGGQEECFRSVLELIFLMDSVFRQKVP